MILGIYLKFTKEMIFNIVCTVGENNFVYQKALIQTFHTTLLTTFVNTQHYTTNSKGDFVLKNQFKTFVLKISGIQKKSDLKLWQITLILIINKG